MTPQLITLPETHPLRTADDRLKVVVAERHIKAGVRGRAESCAVALALIETGHEDPHVCVIEVLVDGREYRVPRELKEWLRAFDDGLPVHPERWVLEPARREFRIGTTQTVQQGGFST